MKEKVIQELIDDEEIFRAIDSPDITDFNDSGRPRKRPYPRKNGTKIIWKGLMKLRNRSTLSVHSWLPCPGMILVLQKQNASL